MGATRQAIKWCSAGFDAVVRPAAGVTILIYHRVGRRTDVEVDLPTSLFAEQLDHLAAHTRVVPLDDAVALLAGVSGADRGATARTDGGDGERPVVAITFDDGTADFAELAVPMLVDRGLPATLYLATGFVEEHRPFPDDGTPVSWGALADAVATGQVTIGSHTHSHALLDRLDPAAVDDELDRSIELIGERLGVEAVHFAYPKAVAPGAAAEQAVRARFASAALAGTRANRPGGTDVHRLARSPIQLADGMRWFRHKVAGGLGAEDRARGLVNRVRYRRATT